VRSARRVTLPTHEHQPDLSGALREVFAAPGAVPPLGALRDAAARLSATYRSGRYPERPVLSTATEAAAYAAYRMAATHAAAAAAFTQTGRVAGGFQPRGQVDLGGGTGAAAWAAAGTWPSLTTIRVLDRAGPALALGRRLAARAHRRHPIAAASWERWRWHGRHEVPAADLVTASYLLAELTEPDQDHLLRAAADAAQLVIVVEPGTPAGHGRILRARASLLGSGMSIVAPCPHELPCPIAEGPDWCHFAARVDRSPLHRRLKDAALGYEDEKFSFVAAARHPLGRAAGRLVRRPRYRKGLVTLPVCESDGELRPRLVSRKHGESYRRARQTRWGDPWPAP
jgi:ribosomal protein RSM22 (predicted rRNA methylase)